MSVEVKRKSFYTGPRVARPGFLPDHDDFIKNHLHMVSFISCEYSACYAVIEMQLILGTTTTPAPFVSSG
jgi:hypothetical protein